jgi:folate-binding protein YgfZ
MWAAETLRVAAWRPRAGFETNNHTILQEVDWLPAAVHLHKGCDRGQETVARAHNLGRPPRRLVFLHLDGSHHTLSARGAEVESGGRVVGRLTSVARHHELGPIALAVIKRNICLNAVCMAAGLSANRRSSSPRLEPVESPGVAVRKRPVRAPWRVGVATPGHSPGGSSSSRRCPASGSC